MAMDDEPAKGGLAATGGRAAARQEAGGWATDAEAMVAHLKLLIATLRHDQYGASSERGRKLLDQLELELEEFEAKAAEDAVAAGDNTDKLAFVSSFTRHASVSLFPARPNAGAAAERSPSWARR
jgi:hypothetical protein